jgi:hypothetical protein
MLVRDNRLYFFRMLSPLDCRWGGAGAEVVRVDTVSGSTIGVTGVLGCVTFRRIGTPDDIEEDEDKGGDVSFMSREEALDARRCMRVEEPMAGRVKCSFRGRLLVRNLPNPPVPDCCVGSSWDDIKETMDGVVDTEGCEPGRGIGSLLLLSLLCRLLPVDRRLLSSSTASPCDDGDDIVDDVVSEVVTVVGIDVASFLLCKSEGSAMVG